MNECQQDLLIISPIKIIKFTITNIAQMGVHVKGFVVPKVVLRPS